MALRIYKIFKTYRNSLSCILVQMQLLAQPCVEGNARSCRFRSGASGADAAKQDELHLVWASWLAASVLEL